MIHPLLFRRSLATIVREASLVVALLSMSCVGVRGQELFREPYRPQFHFAPERNWMNDPNGMVYYEGEWHLFYQYNPHGNTWGHMSWGHAVSRDLVHWKHLPLALAEVNGVMIFSGSAVVDWKNTSGLGIVRAGKKTPSPVIAIFTGHYTDRPLQNQHIAFSNDRGRTWTRFAGNPVLDVKMADFRDPKVMWHEPTSRWIMTVALAAEKKVHFYASPDLKSWKYVGEFGPAGSIDGLWECPDLFPLAVEGSGESKWVLIVNVNPGGPAGGSGCQYFVGQFDGSQFTADPLPASRAERVPHGTLVADFEEDYGGWKAEGEAFGDQPATGTLPNQQPVTGYRGRGLVNSYLRGDASQGTLTSPPFEISAGYISFLIGGGSHAETRVDLRVEGKVARTAKGRDRERLVWQSWDVRDLRGKRAEIQVVDRHSGGWGHINFDHVILADEPARPADESALWADYGADFYAGVSWSDVPRSDGRRVWLGWMSNWQYAGDVPTSPWRSAMSIPRELRLQQTGEGIRLRQVPVTELQSLRGQRHPFHGGTVAQANAWMRENRLQSGPLEMAVEFAPSSSLQGVKLFVGADEATIVGIDREHGHVYVDRTKSGNVKFHPKFASVQSAPLRERDKPVKLHLFVDACSVEVFVNGGEQVLTALVFPTANRRGIELFGPADARITSLEWWPLASIWQ
jgi:sucrose-6-phosphate hydrolase SacC (GH32 family)